MARRARYSCDTVAVVNGYQIEREKVGAATYWHAYKLDADGYVIASFRDCGSKAAAVRLAGEA